MSSLELRAKCILLVETVVIEPLNDEEETIPMVD